MAKVFTRLVMEATQSLDAVDLVGQQTQHRRLVAATGANLQHAAQFARSPVAQELHHARHHTWFGNGLTQAYRQAGVFIGLIDQRAVDKAVTLDAAHGLQHHRVGDALASRELMANLRAMGEMGGGPAPFTARDRSTFLQRLDDLIQAIRRGSR